MGIYQKNEIYYIDYYFKSKRKREKIGPNKKVAETVLYKRKTEIAEGKFLDVKKDQKVRFRAFADMYMENHSKPNKRSWFTCDFKYLRNLTPYFGERYLYEISSMMVEKYKAERKQKVSAATVNREIALLKCMYNRAIDWNIVSENPVRKVKLFKENNTRTRYLEKEEIKNLLAQCSPKLKPVVTLALNTGMRKGEIQNLKWTDIDIKRGIITLRNTKNGESRYVPINEVARKTLISVRKHPLSPFLSCTLPHIHFSPLLISPLSLIANYSHTLTCPALSYAALLAAS